MINDSCYTVYRKWCDSEEYSEQSCINNSIYDEHRDRMVKVISEKGFHEIEDDVIDLCSEVEQAAFVAGIRHGIQFYRELVEGETFDKSKSGA